MSNIPFETIDWKAVPKVEFPGETGTSIIEYNQLSKFVGYWNEKFLQQTLSPKTKLVFKNFTTQRIY